MPDKVRGPAVDEDQTAKRSRTGQAKSPSKVSNFEAERDASAENTDRSGSPAVPYAKRIAARQEAVAAAAGETKETSARAEVAGKHSGPVASVKISDPTEGGPTFVEPEIRPGFIPDGATEEEVRAGKVS